MMVVTVHAGDLTYTGTKAQVINTVEWLASLPHPTKLIIAGNHDLTFDIENYPQYCSSFHRMPEDPIAVKRILTEAGHGILYLEDSAYKLDREHGGWSIYGSPWQPEFGGWAFNKPRGANLREIWERIPENTDILITHGPPRGILDRVVTGESCGCDDLLARVQTIRPLVHIFGHIHEGRGVHVNTDTVFINASTLDRQYQAEHSAIVFDLGRDEHSMSDASIVSNTLTDSN
ncbi:Metallo-dependent phosphatase-like protein [Syncephalis plumigaleata]|nr:Metallo-dependent phosphatase-like protein [Syncephalis plumigaleata]